MPWGRRTPNTDHSSAPGPFIAVRVRSPSCCSLLAHSRLCVCLCLVPFRCARLQRSTRAAPSLNKSKAGRSTRISGCTAQKRQKASSSASPWWKHTRGEGGWRRQPRVAGAFRLQMVCCLCWDRRNMRWVRWWSTLHGWPTSSLPRRWLPPHDVRGCPGSLARHTSANACDPCAGQCRVAFTRCCYSTLQELVKPTVGLRASEDGEKEEGQGDVHNGQG